MLGSHAASPLKANLERNMTENRKMVSKSDKRINSFRFGKCHWSRIVSTESVLWLKCSFSLQFYPCSTVSEPEVCCLRPGRKRRSAGTKQHRLSPSVRRAGWDNADRDVQQIHVRHLKQKIIQNHLCACANIHWTTPERSHAWLLV